MDEKIWLIDSVVEIERKKIVLDPMLCTTIMSNVRKFINYRISLASCNSHGLRELEFMSCGIRRFCARGFLGVISCTVIGRKFGRANGCAPITTVENMSSKSLVSAFRLSRIK